MPAIDPKAIMMMWKCTTGQQVNVFCSPPSRQATRGTPNKNGPPRLQPVRQVVRDQEFWKAPLCPFPAGKWMIVRYFLEKGHNMISIPSRSLFHGQLEAVNVACCGDPKASRCSWKLYWNQQKTRRFVMKDFCRIGLYLIRAAPWVGKGHFGRFQRVLESRKRPWKGKLS